MAQQAGYKHTEIGQIPEGWEVVRLDEIATQFISGGTPSTSNPEYWNGNIPWMRSAWINRRFVDAGERYITEKGLKNSATNTVPQGNILVATRVCIGNIAINKIDIAISQDLTGVVIEKSRAYHEYVYWALRNSENKVKQLVQGSTIRGILREDLKNLKIPLPPLPEQRQIASILSTVDDAIQKTDEIMAETQQLKKGLMQQLLTKGIGHARFKQTEIGEIPEEWEVVRLGEHIEIRGSKTVNNISEIAIIPMELIPYEGVYADYRMVEASEVKSSVYCEQGDILLPKITPSVENGKQGIVPMVPGGIARATTEVYPIKCKASLTSMFLFHLFKLSRFRNVLVNRMTGSTGRQRVPKDAVLDLMIPLPPLPEQEKIASILSGTDDKIEKEKHRKQQLEQLKKGLMQVLLTGKVRVKVN